MPIDVYVNADGAPLRLVRLWKRGRRGLPKLESLEFCLADNDEEF